MASPAPFNAVRGIASSNRLRFAARSRGIELPTPGYCAARHFRSDWAIRTTFGLTDVGINRPFWPCSVLICYGTPEAAKHPHIAFAHLDYNGAV